MTMGQFHRENQSSESAPGWQGPPGRISTHPFDNFIGNLKLGAVPAPLDPRHLRLEDFLVAEPIGVPEAYSNSNVVPNWGMLGNDRKGCCVVSGYGHKVMLEATQARTQQSVTDAEVLALYDQLTHGQDTGLVIQEFLKWARKNLFESRRLLGYAYVDPRNKILSKAAIAMFGSMFRGLMLPRTAQSQTGQGRLWAPVNPGSPDAVPGSWGGHLTLDTGYTPTNFETITWGTVQAATPEFYGMYSMESWVLIPMDPVPGFDYAKFTQALKDLGSNVDFDPVGPTPPSPPQPQPVGPTPPSADWLPAYPQLVDYIVKVMGSIHHVDMNIVFGSENGYHWPFRGNAPQ